MTTIKKNALWLAVSSTVLIFACTSVAPSIKDSILFSHHVHREQEIDCVQCHDAVNNDVNQAVNVYPPMSQCSDCHETERNENCSQCHTNTNAPKTYSSLKKTNILFSHQKHQNRVTNCAACHKDLSDSISGNQKKIQLPGHVSCQSCHQKQFSTDNCLFCHDRLDLYIERPEAICLYEKGFFERHGVRVSDYQNKCGPSFCSDCHAQTMTVKPSARNPEKITRPYIHRGNWITNHATEAAVGDTSCLKCHKNLSYCNGCHEQRGIGHALSPQKQHSPGWTGPAHGKQARRRIQYCASCHDQGAASNCVDCHRTGGHNPHPPGWHPPVSTSERSSHQMCRICHSS